MPISNTHNFVAGEPYRFIEYGKACCVCDGVDYRSLNWPAGFHCRVGAGTPESGAFHQDCNALDANKDRIQVIEYVTDAGVPIRVIRLEGDHDDRTGGAMLLKPLDNYRAWFPGFGIRTTFVFSPRDEVVAQWYMNYELRGRLSFAGGNEGQAALGVAFRRDVFRVMYYRDARDGDRGGSRLYNEFPFLFEYNDWYELNTRLVATEEQYTWRLRIRLRSLSKPNVRIRWDAPEYQLPNRIMTLEHAAMGDEHQGLSDGGVWYFSRVDDEPVINDAALA